MDAYSEHSTFFQSADWPMKDSADPLAGWALKDVLKADSGPATNDIYGKLYIYLHGFLSSFHHRLNSLKVGFELTNHAAEDLGKHLETGTFARIEVRKKVFPVQLGINNPSDNRRFVGFQHFRRRIPGMPTNSCFSQPLATGPDCESPCNAADTVHERRGRGDQAGRCQGEHGD